MFKKGEKVTGRTPRGNLVNGSISDVRETKRGVWVSVTEANGRTVSTRPSLLKSA